MSHKIPVLIFDSRIGLTSAFIRGGKYKKEVYSGTKIVSKENLINPEMQKLLEPYMK